MINTNTEIKRKICHVTSAHQRYDVRIFHKECKSLASNGYDVTLLVNDDLPDETIEGVKIVSTNFKPQNRFERMVKSKKKIRKKIAEIDAELYHFHDPELLIEAEWMKKREKKIIFDFHEDVSSQILFKEWIPNWMRKSISQIYKVYEKRKARYFDALISVTPKFVDRLLEFNDNTVMVTNYPIINFDEKHFTSSNVERAVCFAGGVSSQWNHENIINAISGLQDVRYFLAGSGTQDYLSHLSHLEGWKSVDFYGRISHESVREIYQRSMIGMTLLSHKTQVGDEGTLGNTKIFEFMAAGLPVICSRNKLWDSIIKTYNCGLCVDPDNVEEIKNAMQSLLSDEQKRFEMGQNGILAVEKEFNWRTQEKKLVDLYQDILNGKGTKEYDS